MEKLPYKSLPKMSIEEIRKYLGLIKQQSLDDIREMFYISKKMKESDVYDLVDGLENLYTEFYDKLINLGPDEIIADCRQSTIDTEDLITFIVHPSQLNKLMPYMAYDRSLSGDKEQIIKNTEFMCNTFMEKNTNPKDGLALVRICRWKGDEDIQVFPISFEEVYNELVMHLQCPWGPYTFVGFVVKNRISYDTTFDEMCKIIDQNIEKFGLKRFYEK